MVESPASLVSAMATRHGRTVCREVAGDFYQVSLQAMSTPVRLVFRATRDPVANDFQRAALEWLALFEARFSRFQPDSIVSRINSSAGGDWIELDEEADAIFSLCADMHRLTRQTFDAAVLPLLRLWDWKADPIRIPTDPDVRSALALCGWEKMLRRPMEIRLPIAGMGIDLGGIGKEYAVDQLMELAIDHGISDAMIDIGQDIRVSGHPPGKDAWYLGLEEPEQPGTCFLAVGLTNRALATSGDYFRSCQHNGRRYRHIFDPRSGQPVDNGCQAVSVIIDFWATWCVPCKASFPVLDALNKKFHDQGLTIIGVSTDDEKAKVDRFLKEHPVTFKIVRDAAQKLVAAADVEMMPTSLLIDRAGKIRFIHNGFNGDKTAKEYAEQIEQLLKEPEP